MTGERVKEDAPPLSSLPRWGRKKKEYGRKKKRGDLLRLESKFDSESFLIKLVKENNRPVIELKIYFWDLLSEFRMAMMRESDKKEVSA
ncbi:MAG TPA: hypothetical protein PK512_03875 [bacterium]|nr:hypothetical protein [bacterium]